MSIPANSIFAYYPTKTEGGEPAGFGDVWRRETGSIFRGGRTTCIVRSNDPVETRAYSIWGAAETMPASNRIHPPEPYPSARLSDLTVSKGTLSPAFASDTTSYTLTMSTGETGEFTFTPTAEESRAEIKVDGDVVESGEPSDGFGVNPPKTETATIAVTSYDGQTLNYYVRYSPTTSTTN